MNPGGSCESHYRGPRNWRSGPTVGQSWELFSFGAQRTLHWPTSKPTGNYPKLQWLLGHVACPEGCCARASTIYPARRQVSPVRTGGAALLDRITNSGTAAKPCFSTQPMARRVPKLTESIHNPGLKNPDRSSSPHPAVAVRSFAHEIRPAPHSGATRRSVKLSRLGPSSCSIPN